MNTTAKADMLAKLQKEILELQGLHPPLHPQCQKNELGVMNAAFPNQSFPMTAVHEFISNSYETAASTYGFMIALLYVLMPEGNYLWVSSQSVIFPPALTAFGVIPDNFIFAQVADHKKKMWVMEEALKCESLSAVIGDLSELSFTESRRLQLAVEKSHVTGFIHRHSSQPLHNVACVSRWRISPMESITPNGMPGVGLPQWKVELLKIRNGKPATWNIKWTGTGLEPISHTNQENNISFKKTG